MKIRQNKAQMGKNNSRLVLCWSPGTGGDMVRSCLYPLLFDGKWEYKLYTGDEWFSKYLKMVPYDHDEETTGLHWNDRLISYVPISKGQCITPSMWGIIPTLDDSDFLSDDITYIHERPTDIVASIQKSHHTETSKDWILEIVKKAHDIDELNPLITFICVKDIRYLDIIKKNWKLKSDPTIIDELDWINEFDADIKFREENPDKANHIFHELGSKIHMMYMDNFYDWEKFKKELEDYMSRYNIEGYKENFPVVKQFWQHWIDEQVYK